jgi:phage-related minor tail protein
MADNFGLKIGVEGEKAFKRALSDINQSFKVLGSEMKLVESEFGKNENSVQSLTSKNEVLTKQIDAQKDKIETCVKHLRMHPPRLVKMTAELKLGGPTQ